jgi:hypothetical protein
MTEPPRCEATTTVKGKPCRCDQPATADRGGHAVCLKHDRAVWIEYAKETAPAPGELRPVFGFVPKGERHDS